MLIKDNLQILQERIVHAARAAGRSPQDIKLVAVTKTVPVEKIAEVIEAGVTDIGESRVQEAAEKASILKKRYPHVTWHMIGHLQRNKVKQTLERFDMIQSVDSERLAKEIDVEARARGKTFPVLVEVNTSGEASKYGITVDSAPDFVRILSACTGLRVQGLMTIGPLADDPETARPGFRKLRALKQAIEKLNLPNIEMKYLSMGMSDDFDIAIEEGSNLIRIGQAIFGTRGGK